MGTAARVRVRERGRRRAARDTRERGLWPAGVPRRPRWAALAAALAAAWLAPVACHAARADALLPLIVWLLVASLLRAGATVLDRLVIAFAALAGATMVAALALSAWRALVHPVPVAGAALTALVLAAAATGRRPRLPRPAFAPRDVGVLVIGALAAVIAWAPVAGNGATGRLAVVLSGEDLSRHFMIFDWMRRTGGYLFLTGTGGGLDPNLVAYPQGSHIVAVVLDSFRRPAGAPDGYTSLSDFVDYTLGWYLFLGVAVAWALGWLWAGRLRPACAVISYAVVALVVCFGAFVTMITRGYPSQMAGLGLLVILVALAARPSGGGWGLAVLLGALFAALSFTYYFYLPVAAVALLAWAIPHRRAARARPLAAAVTALATAGLAAITPLVNVARTDTVRGLTYGGPAVPPPKAWLVLLTLLAALALAGRGRPASWPLWRDPVRRTLLITWVGALAFAAALAGARLALGPGVGYYLHKALYGLLTVELVVLGGLGAAVREWVASGAGATSGGADRPPGSILDEQPRRPAGPSRAGGPVPAFVAAAFAVALLAGAGVLDPRPARATGKFPPGPAAGDSYGRAYAEGRLALPALAGAVITAVRAQRPVAGGRLVIFWNAYGRGPDFYAAQWANVLDRRLDAATMAALVEIPKPRTTADQLDRLLSTVAAGAAARPVEVVTRDRATVARVTAFTAAHPGSDVTVLRLPGQAPPG